MKAWRLICRASSQANLYDLIQRLRQLGMLLREPNPEPEFVESLATEATHRMACDQCGETGLVHTEDEGEFDEFDWPEAKACVACGQRIPPERLELFPRSERCASCQESADRGRPVGNDREFCDRCGDVLAMRSRQRGVTRYEMYCPGCGAVS